MRPKGLGMFKQMEAEKEEKGQQKEEVEITNKEEDTKFGQDDLAREWLGMCNRMMKPLPGLAPRLKNITPRITQYPNIEIVVDNQQLLDQLTQFKARIRKTMAIYLHNGNINFNIRLAEADEIKPMLSKRELFDKLSKESQAIDLLRKQLELELT